ncbi:CoA ester lyase [Paraburkholderia acidicola]|uniref:CoA ester lyase n=1 Tax=Paraburkholderia acidicola TaxID=1912599 RepID=A0ABV1LF06_9BURK
MSSSTFFSPSLRTRSWLFTPATRPERFSNAAKSAADVLIVDLEDAVRTDEKQAARQTVRTLLDSAPAHTPALAVRINALSTRFGLDDLAMLLDARHAPTFVLLPKAEAPAQIEQLDALLSAAQKPCALVPLIESARGLSAVEAIAAACPRVVALMFGAADYAADVSAQPQSRALEIARCRIAAAAASAAVQAIDAPCFTIHDAAVLQAELAFASDNGFHAKAAIHPSHVDAIHAAFTPSTERIAWANRVVAASGQGAGVVDGRMVDEAMAREARRVLAGT